MVYKHLAYAYEASFPTENSREAMYMKWKARILITAVLSGLLALAMSLLQEAANMSPSNTAHTDSSIQVVQLSDRNLVDLLVQIPLQLRIRKVELSQSVLSIDLSLPRNVEEALVYRDLYAISQRTITRTSNVNQVLVRIMDYSNASAHTNAQLVLAMAADRDHAQNLDARLQEVSSILLEQQVKARFHLTYTSRWQERYPL
jgi:hypothetical protein